MTDYEIANIDWEAQRKLIKADKTLKEDERKAKLAAIDAFDAQAKAKKK